MSSLSPSSPEITDPPSTSKLQALNYANVLAYASNFLVVFGSTAAGLPDNGTLSAKYQTLVTPSGYAFAIWGVIFTAELVWTIGQLFPRYRSSKLVVKGVGYGFCLACFFQCLWTIFFGLEYIGLSLVAMLGILAPLLAILSRISESSSSMATSVPGYWLLKFPFEIHAAWIMAATLVNINVVLVAYNSSSGVQTAAGWLSLAVVFCTGIYAVTLVATKGYDRVWIVPSVLVWASLAIASELSHPRDSIVATFSETTIEYTMAASRVVATLVSMVTIVEAIRCVFFGPKPRTTIDDDEVLDSDDDNSNEGAGGYSSLR
eukprot:CAMPEP_0201123944 /NCGR_PEP_ID=MMETSP0850-20130426/9442_1 /ASSEMBLY_ACC=CAM_ASM_000622 /TAXON_ID=183588 /ORGANISM="Pseudo-nitzschia fraudulenta, Strain WWA7" /LENGTH=317 /DNA_ID=CAMNT_0047391069 /DNA_START=98 /DNA_END=1051 /DNA_ORIENTATION=+